MVFPEMTKGNPPTHTLILKCVREHIINMNVVTINMFCLDSKIFKTCKRFSKFCFALRVQLKVSFYA